MNIGELLNLPALPRELARVDEALRQTIASDDPFLTEVAAHLISAGGKRLRPTMAIAAALTTNEGEVSSAVISGAAAVELVHLGSLYHDDVLDGALTRRTVPSVNARWDNFMAIIAGDFLLARASGIAATLGTEVTSVLASTIAKLCEGQVREHQYSFRLDRTSEAYEACIAGKTASLIASSCRIGALTSRMSPQQVEALTTFGHAFGMAFQVRDDVLDVVGTDEQLGKPAGNDLVEGVYTLPVIYALTENPAGEELRALLGRPIDTAERDKAREIVRASNGVAQACQRGREWVTEATKALQSIDGNATAQRMSELSDNLFDDLS